VAHSPESCTDRSMRHRTLSFGLGLLETPESPAVERHLLECDECHRDLVTLLRFAAVVDEWSAATDSGAEALRAALAPRLRRDALRFALVGLGSAAAGFALGSLT
jgi:anti-sigma factor RsiW